jgi:hypothetical protein
MSSTFSRARTCCGFRVSNSYLNLLFAMRQKDSKCEFKNMSKAHIVAFRREHQATAEIKGAEAMITLAIIAVTAVVSWWYHRARSNAATKA